MCCSRLGLLVPPALVVLVLVVPLVVALVLVVPLVVALVVSRAAAVDHHRGCSMQAPGCRRRRQAVGAPAAGGPAGAGA